MFRWLKDRNRKSRKPSPSGSRHSKEDDYGFKQTQQQQQQQGDIYKRDLPPTPADLMASSQIADDERSLHIYEEIPDLPFRCTPEGELRITLARERASRKTPDPEPHPGRYGIGAVSARNISPYMVVPLERLRDTPSEFRTENSRFARGVFPAGQAARGDEVTGGAGTGGTPGRDSASPGTSCCGSSVFGSPLGVGGVGGGGDISDRMLNAINLTRLLAAVRLSSSSADTCTTSPICIGVDKDGRNISVSVSVTPTTPTPHNNHPHHHHNNSHHHHHLQHHKEAEDSPSESQPSSGILSTVAKTGSVPQSSSQSLHADAGFQPSSKPQGGFLVSEEGGIPGVNSNANVNSESDSGTQQTVTQQGMGNTGGSQQQPGSVSSASKQQAGMPHAVGGTQLTGSQHTIAAPKALSSSRPEQTVEGPQQAGASQPTTGGSQHMDDPESAGTQNTGVPATGTKHVSGNHETGTVGTQHVSGIHETGTPNTEGPPTVAFRGPGSGSGSGSGRSSSQPTGGGVRLVPSPTEQSAIWEVLQLKPGESTELDPPTIDALILKLCEHTLRPDPGGVGGGGGGGDDDGGVGGGGGGGDDGSALLSSSHNGPLQGQQLQDLEDLLRELLKSGEGEGDGNLLHHHHSPAARRGGAENSDTGFEYDVSTSSESDQTSYDYFLSKAARTRSLECEVKKLIRTSSGSDPDEDGDDGEEDEEGEEGVSEAGESLSTLSTISPVSHGEPAAAATPEPGRSSSAADSDDGTMADLSESENSSGYYESTSHVQPLLDGTGAVDSQHGRKKGSSSSDGQLDIDDVDVPCFELDSGENAAVSGSGTEGHFSAGMPSELYSRICDASGANAVPGGLSGNASGNVGKGKGGGKKSRHHHHHHHHHHSHHHDKEGGGGGGERRTKKSVGGGSGGGGSLRDLSAGDSPASRDANRATARRPSLRDRDADPAHPNPRDSGPRLDIRRASADTATGKLPLSTASPSSSSLGKVPSTTTSTTSLTHLAPPHPHPHPHPRKEKLYGKGAKSKSRSRQAASDYTYSFLHHPSTTTTATAASASFPKHSRSRGSKPRQQRSLQDLERSASVHSRHSLSESVYADTRRQASEVYSIPAALPDPSSSSSSSSLPTSAPGGLKGSVSAPGKISASRQPVPESSEVYGTRAGLQRQRCHNRLLSDLIMLNYNTQVLNM